MQDIEPRLMRAFLAIYGLRSVSAAARAEFVSQPTMSDHLRRLRLHFEDRLFVREGGALLPTPRALEIQPMIQEIVAALTRLSCAGPSWDPAKARRTFRLGTSSYVQAVILPHLDKLLRAQAPDVVLDITSQHTADTDLEIIPTHMIESDRRCQQLFTDVLACAVDPDMAAGVDIDIFCGFEHLVLAPAPSPHHDEIDNALSRIRRSRRIAMIFTHLVGLAPLLIGQRRLAIMPARLTPMLVSRLTGCPIPLVVNPFAISMSWSQQVEGDPAHRWLRAQVATAARCATPYEFTRTPSPAPLMP